MTRTGLFFGSFNPVHIGHLIMAEYMLEFTDLEQIWFVLSPQNPLKEADALENGLRWEMLLAAIDKQAGFSACDIELGMPRPSYTVDTLEALRRKHPDRDFVLIIGSDNLEVFEQWKDHGRIMDSTDIYVYPRPGHYTGHFLSHPRVVRISAPLLGISSSMIRERIRAGKSARFLLPGIVFELIEIRGLYRQGRSFS